MNKSRRIKVLALCVTAVVALGGPGVTLLAQPGNREHPRGKVKAANSGEPKGFELVQKLVEEVLKQKGT